MRKTKAGSKKELQQMQTTDNYGMNQHQNESDGLILESELRNLSEFFESLEMGPGLQE